VKRKKKEKVPVKSVRLVVHTYERLEKLKVELIQQRGKPQVSFDNAINQLLDEHYGLISAKNSKTTGC